MISLHAEVPSNGDILELHDEIDNLERELSEKLGCLAVIHMDPIQKDDERVWEFKELALRVCGEIYENMKLHDFRMVEGSTHTNLIFDVVVPHGFRLSDEELKKQIDEKIKAQDKKLFTVITVDKEYV